MHSDNMDQGTYSVEHAQMMNDFTRGMHTYNVEQGTYNVEHAKMMNDFTSGMHSDNVDQGAMLNIQKLMNNCSNGTRYNK